MIEKKSSVWYKIFTVFNYTFLILLSASMLFPYLNVLAKAFNEGLDSSRGGIFILPRVFTLDNFRAVFGNSLFLSSLSVTVLRVIIGTILSLLVQFAAGYAMTRKQLPFKKVIVFIFMLPMFLNAGQIPTYLLFSKVGLLNNFWVYVLPTLFSFYNAVIMRTFIQSTIPDTLEEAALIDGASEIKIFFRIILPLSLPVLATVALWIIVFHWNDWTTTLLYIKNTKLYTLQYIMMELIKESERAQKMVSDAAAFGVDITTGKAPTSDALISAQIIVTTLPIVCVYPFFQKYFVSGMVVGAVKG